MDKTVVMDLEATLGVVGCSDYVLKTVNIDIVITKFIVASQTIMVIRNLGSTDIPEFWSILWPKRCLPHLLTPCGRPS